MDYGELNAGASKVEILLVAPYAKELWQALAW